MASPLSDNLRALRTRAGLSQDAAAREVGVSYNTLRSWEHGTVPAATNLPALARAYGCSTDQLLGCPPTPGSVLVDRILAEEVLTLTKKNGEVELQRIMNKHAHRSPFSWLAVVPEGGEWMSHEDAAALRARVLSHVELVAPKLYRKWTVGRASYTTEDD